MSVPMVWFDFGGVLSPPLDDLFRAFQRKTGISPAQLRTAIADVGRELGAEPLAPVELGLINERQWGRMLSAALRTAHPELDQSLARWDAFGQQWFDGITANPAMVSAARQLRSHGVRVGVLSNNVPEWESYWKKIIAPLGPVDCVIDSCRVGHRKPDPEIFRIAEKAAGVQAEDCVLVDDLAQNCTGAESSGWAAVHHLDNARVVRELGALTGLRLS